MADPITLDNPTCTIGGTDISDHVSKCELVIEYLTGEVPHTWGSGGPRRSASGKYNWHIILHTITDGYASGELDAIMTALMPAPLGASTTGGRAEVIIKTDSAAVSADNPSYTGDVIVNGWRPIGGGAPGALVVNEHTFMGDGNLAKATS